MKEFQALLSNRVSVDLTGNVRLAGKLIDAGPDVVVLLHQERYLYIPHTHVRQIKADLSNNEESSAAPQLPMEYEIENISTKDILHQAMGLFVELYVSGHVPLHGYVIAVMEDYLVLHSPIYKHIHVSLHHMKWLIPYPAYHVPYSLDFKTLAVQPHTSSLLPTFEEQCKKFEGHLAVFDLGHTIGCIQQVHAGTIAFIDANGNPMFWNVMHLKSLYVPC